MGENKKDLLFLDPESKPNESPFLVDSKNSTNTNTKPTKPTFERLPPSSVLARARDFLPQLKEANKKLEVDVQNNVDVNIEQVDESKPYIQMKLGLGVLEEQKPVTEDNITIPTNSTSSTSENYKPLIEILASSDDESGSDEEEEEEEKDEDVKMKDANTDQT